MTLYELWHRVLAHLCVASELSQVSDWKASHKGMCNQLREMRQGGAARAKAPLNRQNVMARILGRVRLYLCPFAVCHGEAQGRGFVFVQVRSMAFWVCTARSLRELRNGAHCMGDTCVPSPSTPPPRAQTNRFILVRNSYCCR